MAKKLSLLEGFMGTLLEAKETADRVSKDISEKKQTVKSDCPSDCSSDCPSDCSTDCSNEQSDKDILIKKQVVKQEKELKSDCPSECPSDCSKEQSNGQCSGQSNGHSDGHSDGQSNGQSVEHSDGQSEEQSDEHSDEQSDKKIKTVSDENPFYWVTESQFKILSFLIQNTSCITRLKDIQNITKVPYGTVRKSLDVLVKENCISKPLRYRKGQFQGMRYTLNESLCKKFRAIFGEQSDEQSGGQSDGQSDEHSDGQSDERALCRAVKRAVSISSSSSSKNLKTTSKDENFSDQNEKLTLADIEEILQTHPELGYWRRLKLTPRQTSSWIKLIGCSMELMILYLSYCAFDMVENELEKKLRKTPFDYFFRIIEKAGHYPKPKNYKSHEQRRIEDQENLIVEIEKNTKKLKELNAKEGKIKEEYEYEKMFQDKEGENYKWCFNRLNDFTKKLPETHSVFRTLMKKAFGELQIIKQIREIAKNNNKENQMLIEEYRKSFPELVEEALS